MGESPFSMDGVGGELSEAPHEVFVGSVHEVEGRSKTGIGGCAPDAEREEGDWAPVRPLGWFDRHVHPDRRTPDVGHGEREAKCSPPEVRS